MAQPLTRAERSALKEPVLSSQSPPTTTTTTTPTKDGSHTTEENPSNTTTTTIAKETSSPTTQKTPPISLKITREKHTRSSSLSTTNTFPGGESGSNLDCERASRSRSESRGRRSLRCTHFGCKFSTTVSQEFTHHQNTAHTEEKDREALSKENTTTTAAATTTLRRSSTRNTRRTSSTTVAETQAKTSPPPPPPLLTVKNARLTPSGKKPENPVGSKRKLLLTEETSPVNSTEGDSASSSAIIKGHTEEEESATQALLSLKSSEFPPPPKRLATNDSDSQEVAEPAAEPSTMISNSRGAAQPMDCNISGASEDENDMSEDGGGRLIIDDAAMATGGVGGSGPTIVPTRCGNIQNRTYMCDECSYTTNSAQQSLRHQKEEHGHDFIIYECDICDYATRYKQKLPRHYKLHFPGAGSSSMSAHDISQSSDASLSPCPSLPNGANPTVTSTPVPSASAVAPIPFPSTATPITTAATPPSNKRTATEAGFVSLQALPSEVILEEGEDEELDDEDDGATPPPEGAEGADDMAAMMSAAPPAKKKRKDVSPDKYFEVAEEVASTKYGCAKCGNVYKWKKSLNKHWKEKHGTDPGDQSFTPPGMEILLQQNNHTQTEHRRCCHNNLLERITVKQGPMSRSSSRPATPQNFLNGHYSNSLQQQGGQDDEMDGASPGYIPAGPFVIGTSQPVFPGNASQCQKFINSLNAPIPSSSKVLDLSTHTSSNPTLNNNSGDGIDEPDSVDPDDSGNVPLDFSVQRRSNSHASAATPPQGMTSLFHHQDATAEEDEEVIALDQLAQGSVPGKDILKCPKCGEVLKTQTAYSNHMAMHLHSSNKRVAKCGVCCKHFPNNDLLNTHFMDNHIDLIASHKEAIQKIPHGLQQTYHLLKMPIQNIPKLSSQEAEDPLKCNMCDFTAKWPAELQKHAVSHSDERPFVCMVCGSTYKWKWDLVKHFEKAHSNLPNPYKRRDNGNLSGSQSANPELQASGVMASGSHDGYEMEEGEIAPTQIKMQSHNGSSLDMSNSFLFEQSPSHDDISVESIIRTSEQAGIMMRRQPNFLDGPDDTQRPSSCSPNSDRDTPQITDVRSLQGMNLPSTSSQHHHLPNDPQGRAGPVRQALARNIRGRQSGPNQAYPPRGAKTGKGAYKGYKTVENSESSDLKYQCILCDYKARWPSEIMQHMKNHSSEKPYGCPNCSYRSKWKWDVVKHLKRCGGGTIKDVLDYTSKPVARDAPPNVMVTPEGSVVQTQQVLSPTASTSTADDGNAASSALPGIVPINSAPPSASFVPAPFLVSMPTAANVQANVQAMVNAQLLIERFQAASKAGGSAPAESSDQSQSPAPSSPPGSSSQEENTEQSVQDQKRPQQTHQPVPVVFNSLINEGQHHCLLCTFVANSPAELRRHQVLHSDEKPFLCEECGYCTKWKCDMKKHKEKYKHMLPMKYTRPGTSTDTNSAAQDSNKNDDYKCHLCPFESASKDALLMHIKKIHSDRAASSSGKKSPSRRKFVCKTCTFSTNELGDWVNHLRKHKGETGAEESRQSPTPNGASEMDEARLKHPRKAVKKYMCPKCDFVCVKSTELLEHQKQAHGTHRCPFCNQSFDKKDIFLEHLITHPEFNPKEWEHFFMVGSDNEDDENNNNNRSQNDSRQAASTSVSDMGSSANTINLPASSSSSSTRSSPAPIAPDNNRSTPAPDGALPCDWCKARFPNALSLIEHAMSTHPNQMRGQETADTKSSPFLPRAAQIPATAAAAGEKAKLHLGKKGTQSPTPSSSKLNGQLVPGLDWSSVMAGSMLTAPTLVAQLGQTKGIIPAQQHPSTISSSTPSTSSAKQEMVLNLSKSMEQTTPLTCTKCTFKTRDVAKLQQHLQEHVAAERQLAQIRQQSRNKEQLRCWFCSVKVASHLEQYQHMDDKHADLFKQHQAQKEVLVQKIVMEVNSHGKQSPAAAAALRVKPATTKPQTAKATSLLPALPIQALQQPKGGSHAGLEQEAASSMLQAGKQVPTTWLHERKVTTYNGLPVTLVNNGKEQWYKCAMCSVTYGSPAQVSIHTYKVHRDLPRKYQCNHCTDSADQLQQILKHQQMVHPDMLPDITVLTYEEIITSDKSADSVPSASTPSGPYSCKDCDLTFTSKQNLESHALRKHGEPSYVCEYCPFTSGFSDMMEHSKTHGDAKLMAYQTKNAGKPVTMPTPTIKQEPTSFSPPGASTPVHDPFDSAPLDLSAEPDHYPSDKGHSGKEVLPPVKKSSSPIEEKMEVDSDNAAHTEEKTTQRTAVVEKKVEPEVVSRGSKEVAGGHGEKPIRVYKCKHCPFSSSSNFEFRTHCSFHGLSGQHPCDYCTYSHQELDNLLKHRELHADEPGFSPDYKPPEPTPKSPVAAQEEEQVRPASPASEPSYCPDCPYKTTCSSTLGLHVACHHHRMPFICDFCDFTAEQQVEVSQHRQLHNDEPDFTATVEDDALLNLEYPKDHVTGEFEAKLLESRSSTEEAASESAPCDAQSPPFKLSITKKLYSCSHCSFVSGNRGAFDFHQSLHGGSGCYPCEQCSYRTGRWSLLLQHGRLHDEPTTGPASNPAHQDDSDEGTHISPSSSSKTGKTVLTEKHNDDTSSKGEDSPNKDAASCGNSSSASDYGSLISGDAANNNNNAAASSDSVGELRCQHCPYTASSHSALTQHSKHHSGNGQVVCPCCDYNCASKDELLVHIQVHFTSTVVDMDSLLHMLNNPEKKTDTGITKSSVCKSSPGKVLESEAETTEKSSSDKSKDCVGGERKTRVYVCHFCDHEFDDKDQMLKHETQHRGQAAS